MLEGVLNILAVGAHYVDVVLGSGGSLLWLIDEGNKIFIYVGTTSGFKTIKDSSEARNSQEAMDEGLKASSLIGADQLFAGNARTFHLNYCSDLNTELAKIIELNKIDMIFTHWSDDYHHDHWSLSKAVYHAGKHVKRILEYSSNYYEGNNQFSPNFFFDITEYYEKKKELIKIYRSEYERVGDKWDKMIDSVAKLYGLKNNCEYAEGFRCIRWLW